MAASDLPGTERLIERLGADLVPVARLRAPIWRAALWLGALALLAVALACFADVGGMARRLTAAPDMWLGALGSVLTAVLGAIAAFELSMPDREPWWALLPVPALLLWLGASGAGCLRAWVLPGMHTADMGEMRHCLAFIVVFSVPLSALMIWMVSRACPIRPNLTVLVGGLAVAAGAASLLDLFHPYDASATDLLVHLAAVAVVVGLNRLLGGRLLAAEAPRPPM